MTTWRVRPFADADYTAYARIAHPRWAWRSSGPVDAAAARTEDATRDPRYDHLRMVAVDEEDAPVGFGTIYQDPRRHEPGRYFLDIGIDNAMRRRGIGAALWERLSLELAGRSAVVVGLWTGDATACQAFIAKRGFTEVARAYQEVRAVATAPLPTRAISERVTSTGIRITTLEALRDALGATALEDAWALHAAGAAEQVSLGRETPPTLDEWIALNAGDASALPAAHFIALDGARYVGVSAVRSDGPDALRFATTYVLPGYRRRGIGRLLKLRVHAWARANGRRELHTTVTRDNTAMLALNDDLGYPIVGSWGGYELRLSQPLRAR